MKIENCKLKIILLSSFLVLLFAPSAQAGIIVKAAAYLGLQNGLVGCWSFDGSYTEVPDCSGNNNKGTLTGGPTRIMGRVGQALSFDNVDDYVVKTSASNLPTARGSISLWINLKDYPPGGVNDVFVTLSDGTTNNRVAFYIANLLFIFITAAGTGLNVWEQAKTTVPLNEWTQFIVTWDTTTDSYQVYKNGSLVTPNSTGVIGDPTGINKINVASNESNSEILNGRLDEFRVYNRILSAAEIARLYRIGLGSTANRGASTSPLDKGLVGHWTFDGLDISGTRAKDRSGNNFHGTLTNGPVQAVGKVGQALNFDGSNDYVDIGTGPTSVNTVSFWAYPETTIEYFVNLTGTTDFIWVNAGTVTANGLTSPTIYVDGIVSSTLVVNKWQHVAVTTATSENASNLDIARTEDANTLQGKMDDVRIYNRALSAGEINRLFQFTQSKYNSSQTVNSLDQGLVGHWTFDGSDISGTRAKDRSGNNNHGTLTNGPVQAVGKVGQALNFDGSNDYVDIGTGPTSVNTVSFWAYPETTIEYFVNLTGTTDFIWVNAGTVTANGFTSPTIYVDGLVSSTLVANRWQHVAVTTTTSENASNLDIARTEDANILQGKMDDVRVYNRALSTGEVMKLYNMGR